MAMNVSGGKSGPKSDINITPLVDVVLVLLIIFMVITPILQMGYEVQVPPKVESVVPAPSDDQVIVRMDINGNWFINKQMISEKDFPQRLQTVLTGRKSKVVFFAADGELEYDKVADFMDVVRDNGAENLGIVFEDMKSAPAAASGLGTAAATGGP